MGVFHLETVSRRSGSLLKTKANKKTTKQTNKQTNKSKQNNNQRTEPFSVTRAIATFLKIPTASPIYLSLLAVVSGFPFFDPGVWGFISRQNYTSTSSAVGTEKGM